ncbi:MAG: fluoride exporter [Methanolobus sp.]|nr:fluoride exporter [Methanolobus sp.]
MSEQAAFYEKCHPLLVIGMGGVLGAISRFSFSGHFSSSAGTLAVNVLGSILLGFLLYSSEYLGYVNPRTRMFLGTGFLGSFTTFSTFAVQTFQMTSLNASLNILENLALTLGGVFIGRSSAIGLATLRERTVFPSGLGMVRLTGGIYVNPKVYAIAGLAVLILSPAISGGLTMSTGVFLVGAGGFAGAVLRSLVSGAIPKAGDIPAGTLAVNITGSFALALFTFSSVSGSLIYLVSIGILGSFTTFSTFAYESFRLMEQGETKHSLLNIMLNLSMCMAAVMAAYLLTGY